MPLPHFFEFMDLQWLPTGLRNTLREVLECCTTLFRPYNMWVADQVLQTATEGKYQSIVELAAGTAPLSKLLVKDRRSEALRLIVCDEKPDIKAYQALEKAHPGKIIAKYTACDFSKRHQWEPGTLLVVSSSFHHLPGSVRSSALVNLINSADRILIFESLRRTLFSLVFVPGGVIVGILLPILFITRTERLRRFVWCWAIPVAPFLFGWDAFVSCLRQWTEDEWPDRIGAAFEVACNRTRPTLDILPEG